jgi:putative ABC transport system substrate-binding protein
LALLGGVAAALPASVRAQQSAPMRHIGVLTGTAQADPQIKLWLAGFRQGLEELGWHPGRDVGIEYRWGNGDAPRVRAEAAEFAKLSPDVILAIGTTAIAAMKEATASVPVVFAVVNDPVAQGYVSSMAKPGGNITGFSLMDYSVLGKSIGFLKQVAPAITRIAMMFNPDTYPYYETYLKSEAASPSTPLQVTGLRVHSVAEIEPALAKLSGFGLLVAPDTFTNVNRLPIIRAAAQFRIPATYPYRQFVADGGLMAYGPNPADVVRRSAIYVDRILKGAKPADLPVQAPTKFEFLVNAKTAKALGLVVPPNLLFTADEVIE